MSEKMKFKESSVNGLNKNNENHCLVTFEDENNINMDFRTVNSKLLLAAIVTESKNSIDDLKDSIPSEIVSPFDILSSQKAFTIPFDLNLPPPPLKKPSPPLPLYNPITFKLTAS